MRLGSGVGAGVGGAFTPLLTRIARRAPTKHRLFVVADDIAPLVGGKIVQWNSQVAGLPNLVQANAAYREAPGTPINGRAVAEFVGASGLYYSDAPLPINGHDSATVIWVGATTVHNGIIIEHTADYNAHEAFLIYDVSQLTLATHAGASTAAWYKTGANIGYAVRTAVFDNALLGEDQCKMFVDGVRQTGLVAAVPGNPTGNWEDGLLSVGARGADGAPGYPMTGQLAAVYVAIPKLSAQEQADVEGWLMQWAGV